MVEIPPLPTKADAFVTPTPLAIEPEEVLEETLDEVFEPRTSNLVKGLTYLDACKPDEIAEVYVWLAEHPMEGIDPVRLAMASFEALHENEVLDFFNAMRAQMQPDLWKVLTE